jgi:hypothetical protein
LDELETAIGMFRLVRTAVKDVVLAAVEFEGGGDFECCGKAQEGE